MGKIQTFSIVIGTKACDASCPFCVSSMTGFAELPKRREINTRDLRKACRLAQIGGTTTVLFTGKGEPTLYPQEILEYLGHLEEWDFPFIELQTNALEIGRLAAGRASKVAHLDRHMIGRWYDAGLNTVAISTVGIDPGPNAEVYHRDYPDLERTAAFLHGFGFTLRLCVMMVKGGVDAPEKVDEIVSFCKRNGVAQLKMQTVRRPERTEDAEASTFVAERGLSKDEERRIVDHVSSRGRRLMTLMHGAAVYDVDGQNLCLSDCLTVNDEGDDIRTLIYYADGRLAYDWQYDGAVLLGGARDTDGIVPASDLRKTR